MARSGYVYALSNEAAPGVFKVGMSVHHPKRRLQALNLSLGASLDMPQFVLDFFVVVSGCAKAERQVHHLLDSDRVRDDREFFAVSEAKLIEAMEKVAGRPVERYVDGSWPWGVPTIKAGTRKRPSPTFSGQPRVVGWMRLNFRSLKGAERAGELDWPKLAFEYGRHQETQGDRFCPPPPSLMRLAWERAKDLSIRDGGWNGG